jgi:hypothetical protein
MIQMEEEPHVNHTQLEIDRGEGIPLDIAMAQLRDRLHRNQADNG